MGKLWTVRREKSEIMYEILSFCETPQQKTRIMYQNNLSFNQTEKYLKFFLSNGYLRIIKSSRTLYKTTKKGKDFIEAYQKFVETVKGGTS